MGLIALVGDSTFDNAGYVGGDPDVMAALRKLLPIDWRATRLAVDGSVIGNIGAQLASLPIAATHIVLSVGGNDALQMVDLLSQPVTSAGEALDLVANARDGFATSYRTMLDAVLGRGLPTAICTIYEPAFPDAHFRRIANAALTGLNDVILREAFARGLPVLDLRLVCRSDEDFVDVIEPSASGGAKIAAAIARLLTEGDFTGKRSVVFGA
jgi:hypothetical protein